MAAGTDASGKRPFWRRAQGRTVPPAPKTPAASPAPTTTAAPVKKTASPDDAPTHTVWANVNRPFIAGFALTLGGLAAIALGAAISNLVTIWIYIAFALFAALGLDPLVRRLERRGTKRSWAIVIVYFVFAIVMGAVLWLIIPTVVRQISQFFRDIPSMITDFQQTEFYHWANAQFGDQIPDLLGELQRFLSNPANLASIGGGVLQIGISIGTAISGGIIIIVLSLYFLASLPDIKKAFYRMVPARSRPLTEELTEEITDSVGGYLGGMVILALANSIMTFILYSILGLPFPALLAVVAFCITIIPLVGTVLFWGIGSIVALFANPLSALIFAIVYLVYMQLEAYVLTPKVMNKAISVPGSLVVIGALVGGTLMGLLGALVAIPVTASILLIIKKVFIPKQDSKL